MTPRTPFAVPRGPRTGDGQLGAAAPQLNVRANVSETHVVALQRSSTTTSDQVVLTVNLGVIAPEALQSWDSPTSVSSAQWRVRLGELGSVGRDT